MPLPPCTATPAGLWIASSALAESLRAFEVAYGVPKVDADEGGYCMAIEFAASNVDDPRSWVQPPAFLSAWADGAAAAS